MNHWIVKLGGKGFTENDVSKIKSSLILESSSFYELKIDKIHYVSVSTKNKYNYEIDNNLYSYSGLIIDKKNSGFDFRDAESLSHFSSIDDVVENITGHFSLIQIKKDTFKCIIDPLATYKVFYHKINDDEYFVSNSLKLIQVFKSKEINKDFYVNWISIGELIGTETEENNVNYLNIFEFISWKLHDGLKIENNLNLEEVCFPKENEDELLDSVVSEWINSIDYLYKYYDIVLPLSGGYDSRLILNIFSDAQLKRLKTYTYRDNLYDLSIAKKVAKKRKVDHITIETDNSIPALSDLHQFIVAKSNSLLSYNDVFLFKLSQKIENIINFDNVVKLSGNGGGTDVGVRKNLKVNKENRLSEYINSLIKNSPVNNNYKLIQKERFYNYYKNKYKNIINFNSDDIILYSLYAHFERFSVYKCYKSENTDDKTYTPFSNLNFVKLCFLKGTDHLQKNLNNSIHHILTSRLLNNSNFKKVDFVRKHHWDANKLQRALFYFNTKIINEKIISKVYDTVKLSTKIRRNFYQNNLPEYQSILNNNISSELWNYIEYDNIKKIINDSGSIKEISLIHKIIPLLIENKID